MSYIKVMVRGIYDIQKLRIQMGNRIVMNFKAKLGQAPGEAEWTLDDESKALLVSIRQSFKLVADGAVVELEEETAKKEKKLADLVNKLIDKHYALMCPKDVIITKKKFTGDPIISEYTELALITQYKELVKHEEKHFRTLGQVLEDYPLYTQVLEPIRGIGPAMAGVIISEFDIHKADYPSSFVKYAGLDVADDGFGRSRRKEHLKQTEYIDKEGVKKVKDGITFNPLLKTKLTGVLGPSFLRAGDNKYSQIYRDYRLRLENTPHWQNYPGVDKKGKPCIISKKMHRHNAAIRYMIKMFLYDLHPAWRKLEGLSVTAPYHEAKLGLVHKDPGCVGKQAPTVLKKSPYLNQPHMQLAA